MRWKIPEPDTWSSRTATSRRLKAKRPPATIVVPGGVFLSSLAKIIRYTHMAARSAELPQREAVLPTSTRTRQDRSKSSFTNSTIDVKDFAGSLNGEIVGLAAEEIEQGNFAQAEHYLRQGLSRNPDDHHCRAYLEVCRVACGAKTSEAERAVREIMSANPDDPIVYFALGQIFLLGSRRREAFRMFARARQLASEERDIRRQIRRAEPRRQAVFPGLRRDHPLNVIGGRLRALFSRFRQV